MTNIRLCRILFLTGWRCAWLPRPTPIWPTDSDKSSRKIVTVVQNRKLVTWSEHVLTNKQWQRLSFQVVGTRELCESGLKSKVLWSSDEPKITEAFLPSCWNQMIADITLASLWQWPSGQTCRLEQNLFFDRLNNRQCLKLFQPENWWCDMSLSRYHPYVSIRDVHQMTNDKTPTANASRNCSTINLGRKLS